MGERKGQEGREKNGRKERPGGEREEWEEESGNVIID